MNAQSPKSSTGFILFSLCVAVGLAGCEEAGSVVDKVTSTVSGETETPDTPDSSVNETPATKPIASATPTVTPDQLIAEFNGLKPFEINDSALVRVTSLPEAAAAITAIEIKNIDNVSGAGLTAMTAMPNLESLKFTGAMVSAGELSTIGQISSLRELHLNGSKLDDSVLASFGNLKNLEHLNIAGTSITPDVGQILAKLPSLANLNLQATQVNDSTILAISNLPIRALNLSRSRISNAAVPAILKISNLESLDVSFTQVTGAAFKGISRMGLKDLNVGETNFGIDGFAALKGLKKLEHLNVYNSRLVEHTKCNVFRSFPNLKTLNAGGNPLTNAGMNVFFKGHRSLEELSLMSCKSISDLGLKELVGVKTLKVLNVAYTNCTSSGATALKQRLPDCRIVTNDGALD